MKQGAIKGGIKSWLEGVEERVLSFRRTKIHNMSTDPKREWWLYLFEERQLLLKQLHKLCAKIEIIDTGCWVLPNQTVVRIRLQGRRIYAYQLVYWGGNTLIPASDEVVRHKCHNRKCVNPAHLDHGTQRDNKHDEITKWLTGPQS